MRPEDVSPHPIKDAYYAAMPPHQLALLQFVNEEGVEGGTLQFRQWSPHATNTVFFVPPIQLRHLWFSRTVYMLPEFLQRHRVGDVLLAKKRERLFFIGPVGADEEPRVIRILADWTVTHEDIGANIDPEKVMLFQRGPGRRPEDEGFETRYDKAVRGE